MFVWREIAVSLAFFVLFYCFFSAIVPLGWRSLRWLRTTKRNLADLLFAWRVLPLVASVAITFGFVVPSFQLLEPRSIDEGMGALPMALGVLALLLVACGAMRVIAAQVKISRAVAGWLEDARPLDDAASTITFRSRRESPPLTLVGVRRARVLVSESAVALLNREELLIALKHELAHMRSRDNLKKLIFRFCPFPGMAKLENAWSQTAEFAADDAAVSTLDDAVDLAAALVKLSRLVPVEAAPICTVGFVTGSVSERVARLLDWNELRNGGIEDESLRFRSQCGVVTLAMIFGFVVATYGPALALTHEATEWLVR